MGLISKPVRLAADACGLSPAVLRRRTPLPQGRVASRPGQCRCRNHRDRERVPTRPPQGPRTSCPLKTISSTALPRPSAPARRACAELGADVLGIRHAQPRRRLSSFHRGRPTSRRMQASAELGQNAAATHRRLCNVAGVSARSAAAKTMAIKFYGLRALSGQGGFGAAAAARRAAP